jgi:hypothetical protein
MSWPIIKVITWEGITIAPRPRSQLNTSQMFQYTLIAYTYCPPTTVAEMSSSTQALERRVAIPLEASISEYFLRLGSRFATG